MGQQQSTQSMDLSEGSRTKKQTIGTIAGGIIGGIIGGYPGMQIGMAIGGYIFKPDPPKVKDYRNPDYKLERSRIDPVPDVIGTDICPGHVIYLNKATFGIYNASDMPYVGDAGSRVAWQEFFTMMSDSKVAHWAEFAVNFSGRYSETGYEIGVIRFNEKPFWFWMMLSDMFENYDDALDPYYPLSYLDGGQGGFHNEVNVDGLINQPVKDNTVFYFKGFIADFTSLQTTPEQSNFSIDFANMEEMNPSNFEMGKLNVFPTFTVEMNRDRVWYSPESMKGGVATPGNGVNYLQEDLLPSIIYKHPDMTTYWGCRDGRNKMWYGYGAALGGYGITYCDPGERLIRHCASDHPYEIWEIDNIDQWFYDNVAKGGSKLQATDVKDNRAYILTFRNWYNAGTYAHHHAEYGAKIDLYYHDLDDPEYRVHSVLYDEEFSNPSGENENSNPRYYFSSMVVGEDYIYLFGAKVMTDVILYDTRSIVAGANTYSRVYADFSQYPNDYWKECYASLSQNGYDLWREIITQTSTYIDVDGEFAAFPSSGNRVQVCKYPKHVTDYAIVGEGSTSTEIICNVPPVSPWSYGGGKQWERVHFINQWIYGSTISAIDGTKVTLSSPLGATPTPGSRICFGFDRISNDYDTSITNPTLDQDPYDYTQTFLNLGFSEEDNDWPYQPGNIGENFGGAASHHVCLKIHKDTGVIEPFDAARTRIGTYFTQAIWCASIVVYACATDKQAFVYSHGASYPTWKQAYTYIIDFTTGIEEQINRRNQYAAGHAPQWIYMGTTSVKEWDFSTEQYEDVWYSLLRSYDSFGGYNSACEQGTYFLKLGDGKFSNKQVYASATKYGLDIDRRSIRKVLYRKLVATGPLYMPMDLGSFSSESSYKIGKYGVRDDIYFYITRSTAWQAGRHEAWKFIPPSESNPAGELYMISKYPIEAESGYKYQWNRIGASATFKHTKTGFFGNGSGLWYYCDESPPSIIRDFWNNYTDPKYFQDGLTNKLDYSNADSICKKSIDAKIYTPREIIEVKERRFQFSQCYDQAKKMYDVIQDILLTCQGFISPCTWPDGYLYKLIIPNMDETPVAYFGKGSAQFTSNQESDDYSKIYADFSAYPDNYWKGDDIDYGEVMEHWNHPDGQTNVIIEQTSTYIDMGYGIKDYWPDAKQFTLRKDNIREGSFTFAEKSYLRRPNKVRIEFKNRLLDYRKDVAEVEDVYRLDVLEEEEKIDFYKMHGIKRATQAGRMAQRILDQWNYQIHICAFETDIMGMSLCMGEIIGVTHEITGWVNKWFRIIAMDELIDFEVKFELEEFNPYTYHDNGVPVLNGYGRGGFPQPYVPYGVERFEVKEDIESGKLYFTFDAPEGDGGFFVGARIYRKVGTEYEYIAVVNETVSSVLLAQDIGINDTTIYYDNTTLTGSFPSQGVIWIENELMYYHGIDTINHAFTNVIRGYKDTDQVAHVIENDELYIKLRSDATVFYEVPLGWEGTTQTFKASSFTIHGLTVGVDISPSADIDIVGYGVLPYFPESIHIPIGEIAEVEYLFENLGLNDALSSIDFITTLLDALVSKLTPVSTELDAILYGEDLVSLSLDSLLSRLGLTEEISLDALLNEIGLTINTSLDSFLKKLNSVSTELDAILYIVGIVTELDAILNKPGLTLDTSLDSLIKKLNSVITALDAMLTESKIISTDLDVLLQGKEIVTTQLDAILKFLSVVTELDALLNKTGSTIDTDLDAILISDVEEDSIMMILNNNML